MRASRGRDESGQSLIELALVMPVFLLLMFGFVSLAMVMYGLSNATYANHLLIRYACVHSGTSFHPITAADITTILSPYMNNFPANTVATSTSWGAGTPVVGSTITTTISLTYTITLPGYTLTPLTVKTTASGITVQ